MKPAIVCVDDEAIVLDSLREQLRRQFGQQYVIEGAHDSAEALEIIEELHTRGHPIPVVLSDHIMPGMRGDQLLIAVHERLPRTRKILLTGQAGADAVGNIVNLGALYRYIAKPWDKDDLALTIREAVRSFDREEQVERQHAAGLRFVPVEFLRLLGRERIDEVSLHDHVELRLSVLFSDIRSYTSLVEGKTPQETFDFINEYLSHMEPTIREEGGFIDTFSGDGVMALYEGSADRAVRSGLAQLRALDRFNEALAARGHPTIRIGVGINTGPLMLGVIGGRERLKPGVTGDPVNVAARVETFCKQVGASLLVSENTVAALDDASAFALRPVGRVRFKGKTRPLLVHEVLDALPEAERARKLATRGDLIAGRDEMLASRPERALVRFTSAREKDPSDPVLSRHVALCQRFLDEGMPSDWDGATNLEEK
jgi:class 3 adenylate cyclase